MAARYRAVVVGMGKRGMHHASAFFKNPRFELAGICDIDQKRRTTRYLHARPALVEPVVEIHS